MAAVRRRYVIPGETIAQGNYRMMGNVVREGDKFYSTRVGMAEIGREDIRVIPLSGVYIPKVDDFVIGKIVDFSAFAWEVDMNSCFYGYLPAQSVFGRGYSPARDSMNQKFNIGDVIAAGVMAFDRTRDPLLTVSGPGLGKIQAGETVKISPTRVPRLIGKMRSMAKAIESKTGCRMTIGQNGIVVLNGPPESIPKAAKAIKVVEEGAHTPDLIERVQALLS